MMTTKTITLFVIEVLVVGTVILQVLRAMNIAVDMTDCRVWAVLLILGIPSSLVFNRLTR